MVNKKTRATATNKDELLKIASCMLKASAEYIRESDAKNAQLAQENLELRRSLSEKKMAAKVDYILKLMLDKGALKTTAVESKRLELKKMNNEALDQLKEAVEGMTHASGEDEDGLDSLSFMGTTKTEAPRTEQDTINKLATHFANSY